MSQKSLSLASLGSVTVFQRCSNGIRWKRKMIKRYFYLKVGTCLLDFWSYYVHFILQFLEFVFEDIRSRNLQTQEGRLVHVTSVIVLRNSFVTVLLTFVFVRWDRGYKRTFTHIIIRSILGILVVIKNIKILTMFV